VPRIYCAGPLFNDPERLEMAAIAERMEAAGHETFLPQRDGFELADVRRELDAGGQTSQEAVDLVHRAIFHLDVYHLLGWADAVVANLNGRVPDEGTVVEAALAWHAGRALVLFKSDDRAPFVGDDNPMLTCLTDLRIADSIEALANQVDGALAATGDGGVAAAIAAGERIARFNETSPDASDLAAFLAREMDQR
jgi:nucleoside 2-deoxyribosyltransferase